MGGESEEAEGRGRWTALAVHLYTASGVVWAALAAMAIAEADYREAFLWLIVALVVDSTDGTLARRFKVRERWPGIDGRRLDDLVDYLNYTFLPLVLIAHGGWVTEPRIVWVAVAGVASLFGFANARAKEEREGFFLGFPSYWNIFALYVFLLGPHPLEVTVLMILLSVLTVLPVRFLYPSHSARWSRFFTWGGVVWAGLVTWLLLVLPDSHPHLVAVSAFYPASYCVLSFLEHVRSRKTREA